MLATFTFHYAKIKTNADESIFDEIVKFTFHYAKIKTRNNNTLFQFQNIYIPLCKD